MSEKLKVRISGRNDELTVNSFLSVIESSYDLITHLSGKDVTWVVGKVSHNSPISFEFVSSGGGAAVAIHKFHGGMKALNSKSDPHNFFDAKAQKLARKISRPLSNGVADVKFEFKEEAISVPSDITYLEPPAETEPYFAFAEIEGVFEKLDLHGGHKKFSIFDRASGHQTVCDFSSVDVSLAELLQHVTKRLRVTGKAKFNSWHQPIKINVAAFEPVGNSISLGELHKAELRLDSKLTAEQIIRNLRGMDA